MRKCINLILFTVWICICEREHTAKTISVSDPFMAYKILYKIYSTFHGVNGLGPQPHPEY